MNMVLHLVVNLLSLNKILILSRYNTVHEMLSPKDFNYHLSTVHEPVHAWSHDFEPVLCQP